MTQKTPPDTERGKRVRYVRETLLGLGSQEKFAEVLTNEKRVPTTRGAVGNWEQGKNIGIKSMSAIADLANIPLDWLAYGAGEVPSKGAVRQKLAAEGVHNTVPLVGYVRAGATAYYYASATDPLDWVPPVEDGTDDTVAVQIQGDSLGSFFDQWLVYYDEIRSPVTPDLLGRLCVVALLDDRVVVKKVRKAKRAGFYDLLSNTGNDDILDVEVAWAAKVKNMVPR